MNYLYPRTRSQRPRINACERVDISEFVRQFRVEFDEKERSVQRQHPEWRVTPVSEYAPHEFKDFINAPDSRYDFPSLRKIQQGNEFYQEVDTVHSNLGKGYLFFFKCTGCSRRAKYLYRPTPDKPFMCRICHHLKYPDSGRKKRDMSRFLNKPATVLRYTASPDPVISGYAQQAEEALKKLHWEVIGKYAAQRRARPAKKEAKQWQFIIRHRRENV